METYPVELGEQDALMLRTAVCYLQQSLMGRDREFEPDATNRVFVEAISQLARLGVDLEHIHLVLEGRAGVKREKELADVDLPY